MQNSNSSVSNNGNLNHTFNTEFGNKAGLKISSSLSDIMELKRKIKTTRNELVENFVGKIGNQERQITAKFGSHAANLEKLKQTKRKMQQRQDEYDREKHAKMRLFTN